ncbi:ATPase domain-containing protein [Haloarchaeobius amylolyticus]|uniref:ATPase domain-containing protein n=1 Tax=Haloarchaeobius amylolyticus TaxID=1198296 RepID=UPI002270A7E1|nr:ATPase domain-containing protein [Haloarchaeobius amylolyticus]
MDETGERCSTGVPGLDQVLHGGFVPGRSYMVSGRPGTGKTILGMHFLLEDPENALYVAFEEREKDIRANAAALGFDLGDVTILDLSPDAESFQSRMHYDVFEPPDVEEDITQHVVEAVDDLRPTRVFVDPLTQLRYFAPDDYQFRTEVAGFMSYLKDSDATVVFTTQPMPNMPDADLEFICDGSMDLGYAAKGRTLTVTKFRGSGFQGGIHTMRITSSGIAVYPELVPTVRSREFDADTMSTGISEMDSLLNGGIERGTVTVISGPSGVGKTTTGSQLMSAAAEHGGRSVIYMFEESTDTFTHRSESIGIPVREMMDAGTLDVVEVEPLAVSSDEFAYMVREEVEEKGTKVVMIDGISGYRLSIRGDDDELVRELHALCRYLRGMGVTTLLVDDVAPITGDFQPTSERISYLGDNILFLRYLELHGEINRAMGVLKMRTSDFERTLREFEIRSDGLHLGDPLTGLQGVLTGTPEYVEDRGE